VTDDKGARDGLPLASPTAPKQRRPVTLADVTRAFAENRGRLPMPPPEALSDLVGLLNGPRREKIPGRGGWEICHAVRVILDDAPNVIARFRGASQQQKAWALLLTAAEALQRAHLPIPRRDELPPRAEQSNSLAQIADRDWVALCVRRTLEAARQGKPVSFGKPEDPAVKITQAVLSLRGINVTAEAIARHATRRAARMTASRRRCQTKPHRRAHK
jgi:hypothetical protein